MGLQTNGSLAGGILGISGPQRTVIMKLRQGVQFHNGLSINAESVKYQMEWIKDPGQRGLDPGLDRTAGVCRSSR